jgi:hypothetical protein
MGVCLPSAIEFLSRHGFASRRTESSGFNSSPHHIWMRTNLDGSRVSDSGALCSILVHRRWPYPLGVGHIVIQASSRGHHQPAVAAPGHRPPDPPCQSHTVTITSSHGKHNRARQALTRIAGFFAELTTLSNCFGPTWESATNQESISRSRYQS